MKNILLFFSSLFTKKYPTGVTIDTRSPEEKSKDYLHEEATSPSPIYGTKPVESPYPLENQNQTSTCIAHGTTLSLGVATAGSGRGYTRLSKEFVYRLRSNYPQPGMWLQGAFEAERINGSCLYSTLPNHQTEAEANAVIITPQMLTEASIFKGQEYYQFDDPTNIDSLAQASSQGYAVAIIIYASYREWAQKYPQILDNVLFATAPVRHCITILPNSAFVENGKKYVMIQDSAWFGSIQLRYVSEDFIKARCYGAGYWKSVSMKKGAGDRPLHTFDVHQSLSIGMSGPEVKALQDILIYEGFLPSDLNTGYFGGRTQAGVKAFQSEYASAILTPIGLTEPTGLPAVGCRKKEIV
jgi:hypothetical protein